MLTSIRIRDFKSFADAEAPLGPLTLLVGANASGKSNVLDALRVLKGVAARAAPIDQILQGYEYKNGARWAGVRGGIHESFRNGAGAFTLETRCRLSPTEELGYAITCAAAPHTHLRVEALTSAGSAQPVFEARVLPYDPTNEADFPMVLTVGDHHEPVRTSQMRWAVLGRPDRLDVGPSTARPLAERVKDALSQLVFLDINPAAMRRYVPKEMQDLGEDGQSLSAILFRLCQDPDNKQGLVDWLAELCAPELADIDFSTTDEGEVMLRIVEKDGIRVSARSISDGTLRFLGELLALRTAPSGSVILMEEIGSGLHPRRVHLLVEYLEAITEERDIQVIATTHSPLVLQALGQRARGDVVVLGRVPDRPGTVMRRLADLPRFEELAEQRGVDYLFTTGWLEQAL